MEGPGMSLFQGAASIHINNSAQDRLEEQEELEDQKRRNEELQKKLATAFDDLGEDDEASSVNSSGVNFTLEAGLTNGGLKDTGHGSGPGLPTYVESLNHLNKVQHEESPKINCETPQNHMAQLHQGDHGKIHFSPYGAGDGQNHYCHSDFRGQVNGIENRQEYMKHEQLKLMYEMRVKECHQLASELEELRSHAGADCEGLRARLAAAVSDREKAELSRQQAQHLLASSKHSMLEMEQQMTALTGKLSESEVEKEQLQLELRSANLTLQDVQQRLHSLQVAHTHDTDSLFREQQDRHREEVDRLHNDLLKCKSRLEDKDNEVKTLEKRCMEREREKDAIIIEKGSTINRLLRELDEAQRRPAGGEVARIKERAAQFLAERNTARDQLKELGSKLELTAHELVLCRNKLTATQQEFEGWRTNLHQMIAEALPENTYLGEPQSPGKLTTLKDILCRYKQQMQRIAALQEEISKRDKKLELHRKQESELRAKLEDQKGYEMQLSSRAAVLQNKLELLAASSEGELTEQYRLQAEAMQRELDHCRAEYKTLDLKYTELELEHDKLKSERGGRATLVSEANADLLKELERCSSQLKDTLKENGELKTLYLQACSGRDAVSREIKELQTQLNKEKELFKLQETDYIERLEQDKRQIEKLSGELTVYREELERANSRISELQKEFSDKQKEFTSKLNQYLEDEKSSMRKDLESCAQCEKYLKTIKNLEDKINKCSLKLATQGSNEELMNELKNKAEFFQKYILERFQKLQEQRHVGTNTENAHTEINGTVSEHEHCDERADRVSDDEMTSKMSLMLKEKEIRDQIAQKFTLEIKTIEMNCTKRLKEMENEHINAISKLKQLLEKKAQEVETLKEFILSERTKVSQILSSKESEVADLIKEHNAMQQEYQQLKDKAGMLKDRYQEKLKLIEEKFKSDKEAYKKNVAEFENQNQALESKLSNLESDYQLLKAKYKNAKKTAFMYKDYVQKKDEHVTSELGRIQGEYKEIFMKLEGRIKALGNRRAPPTGEPQHSEQQENLHYDYTAMLDRLQSEITALSEARRIEIE